MSNIFDVIKYGNPLLRQTAKYIDNIDQNICDLMNDMVHTMELANGIGLAAPQIGKSLRLFVLKDHQDKVIKMVNPVIHLGGKKVVINEGCLSIPGIYLPIERPKTVEVEFISPDGKKNISKFDGLTSRVIQHEQDHLDGKLIVDNLDPEHRRWLVNNLNLFVRGSIIGPS